MTYLSTGAYDRDVPQPVDEQTVLDLVDLVSAHGSDELVPGVPSARDRGNRLQHAAYVDHLALLAVRAAATNPEDVELAHQAQTAVNRAQSWARIMHEFDLHYRSSRGPILAQDLDRTLAGSGERARRYLRQEWTHRPAMVPTGASEN